jgi:hypothetical protein
MFVCNAAEFGPSRLSHLWAVAINGYFLLSEPQTADQSHRPMPATNKMKRGSEEKLRKGRPAGYFGSIPV